MVLGIEVDGYSHEFLDIQEKDTIKEKRMNELRISVLPFSDYKVLKDTENVIRVVAFYISEYEKHTPNPSQEGN
ncbi:hypothetical protein ACFX5D_01795 [Flavobacterium sp. LB3P45]|uniref:DUF559 domain-containing protein n=1 Tax=Flavobacterium fructosi TaxID=3230416 RepID=A0ABW6HI52_9FLAO